METNHPQTALPWRELAARAATLGDDSAWKSPPMPMLTPTAPPPTPASPVGARPPPARIPGASPASSPPMDRGIELAWLCRPENTPRTPTDVDAETCALERLDIPYFSAPATFPGDAPWLTADAASLKCHLRAQAFLLRRVLEKG